MTGTGTPSPPTGYDVSKPVHAGGSDCHITVGFDKQLTHIPRFLIQFHYQTATNPVRWNAIARMDHNETSMMGHDVYKEGLHVDVDRRSSEEVHLKLAHSPLPPNRGKVIRGCVDYFRQEKSYFIDVYKERIVPGGPPKWSDGGKTTYNFIRRNTIEENMSQESPLEDSLSPDELTELLADTTGTTAEEINEGASDLKIASPEEATVVDE